MGAWRDGHGCRLDEDLLREFLIAFEGARRSAIAGGAGRGRSDTGLRLHARQALRDVGQVQPGQQVLIVGASGGVGAFAVQIARQLGAEVTGVSGPDSRSLVEGLGAGRVIDYTREDFAADGARRARPRKGRPLGQRGRPGRGGER